MDQKYGDIYSKLTNQTERDTTKDTPKGVPDGWEPLKKGEYACSSVTYHISDDGFPEYPENMSVLKNLIETCDNINALIVNLNSIAGAIGGINTQNLVPITSDNSVFFNEESPECFSVMAGTMAICRAANACSNISAEIVKQIRGR